MTRLDRARESRRPGLLAAGLMIGTAFLALAGDSQAIRVRPRGAHAERNENTTAWATSPTAAKTAAAVPAQDPAALAEGQALFRGLCTGCHGGTGRGGKGPDLTDNRWIHGSTDQDIARVIQNGVPKTTMKKLGDALKPDQIKKLVAYIRSLARSPTEGNWKPYIAGDPQAGRTALLRSTRERHSAQNVIASPAMADASGQRSTGSPAGARPSF